MAAKKSFRDAMDGQDRINKKGVALIAAGALLIILAIIIVPRLLHKEKEVVTQTKTVTPMVPSSIRYYDPAVSEGYTTGSDYIILNQSDGSRIRVDASGNAYYVDDNGNIISVVDDPSDAVLQAMQIMETDQAAAIALAGLEPEDEAAAAAEKMFTFEQELTSILSSQGRTLEEFYSMLYSLGNTPEALLTYYEMSGLPLATIVNNIISEWNEANPAPEVVETAPEGMSATILDGNTNATAATSTTEELPSWLQPITMDDSMNAMMNTLASAVQGQATDNRTNYEKQNDQQRKQSWMEEQQNVEVTSAKLGRWDLATGTVIPVTLVTGLNTDMPGKIVGTVRQNIYDTVTGTNIVIPKGSRVVANYDSAVSFGQKRVAIAWNQLVTPDGYTFTLPGFIGVDGEGYAGNEDKHSNHIFSLLSGAFLASLLDYSVGSLEDSADQMANVSSTYALISALSGGTLNATQSVGEQYISRLIDRQPTIKIRPGAQITMLVTSNINLERK